MLTVFAAGAAMAGAAALLASPGAGVGMADPTPSKFFLEALGRLEAGKVVAGLVKSVLFGMAVALSAYFSGSRERLDPGSTGRAITRALVASFIAIVALDLLVSALGWNG
ncbi:MAG: hypothetical protein BWZ10_02509 [candidate division BRC1 bacterium ADurb.BinA364]|nr:MAG: hypothetical protein BWZ10_02509 [candidate division BRC1 bacterium ADurb.BinA364]